MEKIRLNMTVNGKDVEVLTEPRQLLAHVLREELNLTGTHIGCETSHCGACTVDMNDMSVKSCSVFAAQAQGANITTIEGLGHLMDFIYCRKCLKNIMVYSAATVHPA